MAEALCLQVKGWGDLDTSLRDATSPSNVSENEPAAKRPRLSLSLKQGASTATRFEFLDNTREEALSKKFPQNTEKSTQWALSTFLTWRDKHNLRVRYP